MTTLTAGQTFSRKRGFRRPDRSSSKRWWIVGVQNLNGDKIAAYGTEYLYIEEVIHSALVGDVAIYRQWVVDPDGTDVENQFTPRRNQYDFRPLESLRAAIRTMKMQDVTVRAAPSQPVEGLPADNAVVRFPIERRFAA
jgi:hypothetical protein